MAGIWRPVKIGGGGYITGIDTDPNGVTKVCRTDTYGGYVWEASSGSWRQVITKTSMAAAAHYPDFTAGISEFRIAPNNPNIFYIAWMGDIWKSTNAGATWTETNANWGALIETTGNNAARFLGQKMAVDPANPDVVYFGTPSSGVIRTINGGTSWATISTVDIPACTGTLAGVNPGHPGICFDPTSGLTGGATNTIYVPVYGTGVYRSIDAGSTWTLLAGGPTSVRHARVADDGIYYAANTHGTLANQLYRYDGAWTAIGPGSGTVESVLTTPGNAARILALYSNGILRASDNRGTTWGTFINANTSVTRTSADVPWLAVTRHQSMDAADALLDPAAAGRVWFADGVGVWTLIHSGNPSSLAWTSRVQGIENLTSNCPILPPGGPALLCSWDRPIFTSSNPDIYPSWHGPDRRFTSVNIDTTNDTIYLPNHKLPSNLNVVIGTISGTPPAPLVNFVPYFVIVADADHIKLSATAGPGAAINLTDVGSGEHQLSNEPIRMAWHADWATSNPAFVAYVASWDLAKPHQGYYSNDSGQTWQAFDAQPGGAGETDSGINGPGSADKLGGCIACSSASNIIWISSNNSQPYVTTDGGVTWTEKLISGVPRWMIGNVTSGSPVITNLPDTSNLVVHGGAFFGEIDAGISYPGGRVLSIDSPTQITTNANATGTGTVTIRFRSGWGWAYFNKAIVVAADRVTANCFYLWNYATQGIYRSTDSGATWTKMNTGSIDAQASVSQKLKAVPNNAGHLFLSSGKVGNPGDPNPAGNKLWRSINSGATWTEVAGGTIREPYCVGFGKAAPGQTYPAVYFAGWRNGVWGIYRSIDNCLSWTQIGDFANVVEINGSLDTYGLVYVTLNGNGFAYYSESNGGGGGGGATMPTPIIPQSVLRRVSRLRKRRRSQSQ